MTYSIPDFTIRSPGNDGGHHSLSTHVDHRGQRRKLVVFFAAKADERNMRTATQVTVTGELIDQGPPQSLLLRDAALLDWEPAQTVISIPFTLFTGYH